MELRRLKDSLSRSFDVSKDTAPVTSHPIDCPLLCHCKPTALNCKLVFPFGRKHAGCCVWPMHRQPLTSPYLTVRGTSSSESETWRFTINSPSIGYGAKHLEFYYKKNEDEIASSIVVNTLNNSQLGGWDGNHFLRAGQTTRGGNIPVQFTCDGWEHSHFDHVLHSGPLQ